ncbi:MAG: SDR family NAD(P)-dependent oxidoreductase [Phycisphaerae bacterium]
MDRKKIAIVTGGGRGIGRAVCRQLAADGIHVVAAARTQSQLEETRDAINASGGTCDIIAADLTRESDVQATIEYAGSINGHVDILINAAGVAPCMPVEAWSEDAFQHMLQVNVTAVFNACRLAWPIMKKTGGVIVNISSVAAIDPFPGLGAYGATKAWVNIWSKALAEEGRPHGIHVFSVGPGAVETDMLRSAFPDFPAEQCLTTDEIADVIVGCTRENMRYATGQIIYARK